MASQGFALGPVNPVTAQMLQGLTASPIAQARHGNARKCANQVLAGSSRMGMSNGYQIQSTPIPVGVSANRRGAGRRKPRFNRRAVSSFRITEPQLPS